VRRATLTIASGVVFFVGLILSPLAFMGIGYGSLTGYGVAVVTFAMIIVGIVGILRFYRRSA
jgi:hypothetical protein